MMSSSTAITWQSWSRKWGDWTIWMRNMTNTRSGVHRSLRVTSVDLKRQIEKAQNSTKMAH